MNKKYILMMIILLFMIPGCSEKTSKEFIWGNLRNLGPNINSPQKDEHVTLTEHGKTMYFASDRENGIGNYDIYMSRFENNEWGKALLLPPPVNTERDEFDVFVTLDGKKLFFASNRDNEDPYWNCDIYISEWNGKSWEHPRIFDSTLVTPGKPDWGITFPKDFKTCIFSSGRKPSKQGMVQIFQSVRLRHGWSEPEKLSQPVNTGGWEATPYVTPEGKTLYLNSARGRTDKKDVDIWKFDRIDDKWSNATLMDGPFLSDKHDYDPCLSPDRQYFYFTSTRDRGFGNSDIWVAERIEKKSHK